MTTHLRSALEDYRNSLELSKSGHTVAAYCADVGAFIAFLEEKRITKVAAIKGNHLQDYLRFRKSQGIGDSSLARYFMSARHFAKWAHKNKLCTQDFSAHVDKPRTAEYAPFIPTKEQMCTLLSMPNTATEAGTRDKAILETLYSSGLRASELCNLDIEDLRHNTLHVQYGKGNKSRVVPLTQSCTEAIGDYIQQYRGKEPGALFCTVAHMKRLPRKYLCTIIANYAKKAGIADVTTHTLRHACATHLLEQGADIRMIQLVLGHATISSTQRYTHLSSVKLGEMFQKFHPRSSHGAT